MNNWGTNIKQEFYDFFHLWPAHNLIIVNCKLELKNMGKNELLLSLAMERKNKVEHDNIKDKKFGGNVFWPLN